MFPEDSVFFERKENGGQESLGGTEDKSQVGPGRRRLKFFSIRFIFFFFISFHDLLGNNRGGRKYYGVEVYDRSQSGRSGCPCSSINSPLAKILGEGT